jgi:hypothetical protein
VSVINKTFVKSIKTLFRTISPLKQVPEIQAAVAAGTLPVSQGYIFAANLDKNISIENPVTNSKLEKMTTGCLLHTLKKFPITFISPLCNGKHGEENVLLQNLTSKVILCIILI